MKVTVTVDTERLAKFGGGDEHVLEFFRRMAAESKTGSSIAWTTTCANVGTIDKLEVSA